MTVSIPYPFSVLTVTSDDSRTWSLTCTSLLNVESQQHAEENDDQSGNYDPSNTSA